MSCTTPNKLYSPLKNYISQLKVMCHRYIWGSRGNMAWMEEGTGGHRCGSRSQVGWKLKVKVASVLSSSLQQYELYPPGSSVPGDSPGKNTGVDSHALLQGIFPTQGSHPGLLHCRRILYQLSKGNSESKSNSFSFHPPPQNILLLCMDTQYTVIPSSQQHV